MDGPRGTWLLRYRLPILGVLLGASLWFVYLAQELRFDFSPQQLFETAERDEEWEFWEETIADFGRDDMTLFVVLEAADGRDVLTEPLRDWLAAIGERFEGSEHIDRVTSLGNAVTVRSTPDGDVEVGTTRDLSAETLLADPLVAGTLVSLDRTMALALLDIQPGRRSIDDLQPAVEAVEAWVEANPPPEDARVHLAGIPFIRVDVVESIKLDQLRFAPFTLAVLAGFLFFSFRRLSRVVLPLLTVGLATTWVSGFMVLIDVPVDIINHVVSSLILVIGVSDGLHLMVRDQEEHASGKPRSTSLSIAVRTLAAACFLTSFTTAAGFASLGASSTRILQNFGLIVAFGVLAAYVLTLGVLPQTLSFTAEPRSVDSRKEIFGGIAVALGRVAIRHSVLVVVLGVLACGAMAAVGWWRVSVDVRLTEVYREGHPVEVMQRRIDDALGGVLPMDLVLSLPDELAHHDPDILARVAALQDRVGALEGITMTRSVVDFLAALHAALAGPDAGRLPQTRELAAQEWLISELGETQLPLERFVADGGRKLRIFLRTADIGGQRAAALEREVQAAVADIFGDRPEIGARLTGDGFIASKNLSTLIHDLFRSLALASGVIFITLLIAFRSPRLALLAVLPNATPLIATIGLMGVIGMNLDVTNVVIFSIALGLAVDDTIHVIARFREELGGEGDIEQVLLRTLRGTGQAVVLTTALLGVGMLTLTFSEFVPTRRFGSLTAFTLLIAVFADLLLLPALLHLVYRRHRK